MKDFQEFFKHRILYIFAVIIVLSSLIAIASAEIYAATSTDLYSKDEYFEQSDLIDGIKVTLTVRAGATESEEETFSKENNEDFSHAAEALLGIEKKDNPIIRHSIYRISLKEMKGHGKVVMENLDITELQEQYSGCQIGIYVLKYNAEDRIMFSLMEPGIYDVVTVIKQKTDNNTNDIYTLMPDDAGIMIHNGETIQVQAGQQIIETDDELKWESSDTHIFVISSEGELTACYPGKANLKVSLPNGNVLTETTVTVKPNYRALLIDELGNMDRENSEDVNPVMNMLSSVNGADGEPYIVFSFDHLIGEEVYDKIDQFLAVPSRNGDVSLFFFASSEKNFPVYDQNASNQRCNNGESWLELHELARVLSAVNGKVIALFEFCIPEIVIPENGDLDLSNIGKGKEEKGKINSLGMAELIVSTFDEADPGLTVYLSNESEGICNNEELNDYEKQKASGELWKTEKFVVMAMLTSLKEDSLNGEYIDKQILSQMMEGVGTSGPMPADVENGNGDGKLTLDELYQYVYKHTRHKQIPQVYPKNSDYVLFLRK